MANRSPELLVSQRNDLMGALQAVDVDPSGFVWGWELSSYSHRQAPVLRHRSGQYQFLVDFGSAGGAVEFSPSDDRPKEYVHIHDWGEVRLYGAKWARCLAKELDTVDLWAELGRERELAAAGENEENNEPFDAGDLESVGALLGEMRELVRATYQLTAEQADLLDRRFGYLDRAAKRVGRVDWVNLLMSTFVQLVLQGVLTTDAARDALALARRGLAGLFPELTALP